MFGNTRKTIGVFISHVNEEFQDTLSKGIITKAKELDYNVAFFTNFGGYGTNAYDMGEFYISDLPNYEELDGIIIAPDTMIVPNLENQYHNNIKNRTKCPVVSVRREIPGYYNVLVDDSTLLDDIIRHFVTIHGFRRINYLSGPKEIADAEKRLSSYKRILTEYHIPIEEGRIYYGDFWKDSGMAAVDYWLEHDQKLPQAIVCGNDYMALTVIQTLLDRGIAVPEQIAVTGCDDLASAGEYSPSLTTVRMPVDQMGKEAVTKIHNHLLGITQPQNTLLSTDTVYRASCGCRRHSYQVTGEHRRSQIYEKEAMHTDIFRNAYMLTDLTGLTKLEEVVDKLWPHIDVNINSTHFCLCLQRDWDEYHTDPEGNRLNNSDEMLMVVGIKDQRRFTMTKFRKKELIPPELYDDRAMVYYFALLHHQRHCFGYIGISYSTVQTCMLTFQGWLINISNALENIRIHNELNRLVYKLEDMSVRDELTQLYNRRVLDTLGMKYLDHCISGSAKLMIFTADMDKLKYINDKYGHIYGDIALKVIANALACAADDDEICIRMGGDEFMAIGMDYDDNKLKKFIIKFVGELNKFNFMNEFDFSVYVSYGHYLIQPEAGTTIENCIKAADLQMYQQKYDKEAKQIKANLVY